MTCAWTTLLKGFVTRSASARAPLLQALAHASAFFCDLLSLCMRVFRVFVVRVSCGAQCRHLFAVSPWCAVSSFAHCRVLQIRITSEAARAELQRVVVAANDASVFAASVDSESALRLAYAPLAMAIGAESGVPFNRPSCVSVH